MLKGILLLWLSSSIAVTFTVQAIAQTLITEVSPPEVTPSEVDESIEPPASPPPIAPSESSEPSPELDLLSPNIEPVPPNTESASPPSATELRFQVRGIQVSGSTVLQDEIATLIQLLLGQEVTFEDLVNLRSAITQLYIDRGYITSGAFLPNNQDLSDGIVEIQVVEGELENIEIAGLQRLRESYVRDRLNLAAPSPLNQQRLVEALQLLQLDPLIQQVNAELTAGSAPGQNILLVNVQEASPFSLGVGGNNYQSPSIGSEQFSIDASYSNILGFGDRISAGYGITEGLDSFDVSYSIPVNARDGTVSMGYSTDASIIVDEEFADLEIRSDSETLFAQFRQPIIRTPETEFALGLQLDLRRSETFLDDRPFSFTDGTDNGESKVTVLRFAQDWVDRDARRVLAARSQFSFGMDAFDATANDFGADGQFFAWLGQFQYVQQITPRLLLVTRVATQLTPDDLLPLERFGFGGAETVRGYRQNQLVTDNGILGTVEARFGLISDDPNRLQLISFVDVGHGWNNNTPAPDPATLPSVGLGLRWLITPDLAVRVDYGIPLVEVENTGDSLQDNGIYLSVRYQPF